MRTYLSIDVDYFRFLENREEKLATLIERCVSLQVPIAYKTEHHELLSNMNKYKFDKLINLDHHSDLPDLYKYLHLNDGTWAGYIKGKENKTFVWIMPFQECYRKGSGRPVYFKKIDRHVYTGRCDGQRNPFINSPKTCGWKKAVKKVGFVTKRELNDVSCIGITLSPDYIDKSLGYFTAHLLYDRGIISQKTRNREVRRHCGDIMI